VKCITLPYFDQPGKYTYYCALVWAESLAHAAQLKLKMKVNLKRRSQSETSILSSSRYRRPHPAQLTPDYKPSSQEINLQLVIASPLDLIPGALRSQSYYRSHSPFEAWQYLRAKPQLKDLDDNLIWSLVANLWQDNTTADQLAAGKELYAANCAACHGVEGSGNGVFWIVKTGSCWRYADRRAQPPVPGRFTDPVQDAGRQPALLHGKIVRGGMGTGMPTGDRFTDDQVWSLVVVVDFQFHYVDGSSHE
jgi:cytochrome c553